MNQVPWCTRKLTSWYLADPVGSRHPGQTAFTLLECRICPCVVQIEFTCSKGWVLSITMWELLWQGLKILLVVVGS